MGSKINCFCHSVRVVGWFGSSIDFTLWFSVLYFLCSFKKYPLESFSYTIQIPGAYFSVSKRVLWFGTKFLERNLLGNFSILWFFIIFIYTVHANGGLHFTLPSSFHYVVFLFSFSLVVWVFSRYFLLIFMILLNLGNESNWPKHFKVAERAV